MYDSPMFLNMLVLLVMIPVGVLTAWGILRGLDKLSGVNFRKDVITTMPFSNGLGVYYGLRFFGVCYLVAALASRFV